MKSLSGHNRSRENFISVSDLKAAFRLAVVGFEPTPPKRLEPKSSALDRSATLPHYIISLYGSSK